MATVAEETDCHFKSDCGQRNMSLLEEVESNASAKKS